MALELETDTLTLFSNLSTLRLASCRLPRAIGSWLDLSTTNIRHLDLHNARFDYSGPTTTATDDSLKIDDDDDETWSHCSKRLEWLDVSSMGLKSLRVPSRCSSLHWLYAEHNQIVIASIKTRSLRSLYLRGNALQRWPLETGLLASHYGRLEVLDLADNQLEVS